ncbi:MAG: hypothetical protein H6745_00320 [Deltaproteobacteria bacterium]|nr:hypothetical protein [Deltaproteobacteria bacterium]
MKLISRRSLGVAVAALALATTACGKKEEPAPAPAATSEPAAADPAKEETAAPEEPAKEEPAPEEPTAAAADAAAAPVEDSAEAKAVKGIAKTILDAYKAKDLQKLGEFAPEAVQEQIKAMKPGDKVYDQIFDESNWRWKSVTSWDGSFDGIRQDEDKYWVKYANLDGEEVAVVKLKKEGDKWLFDDLGSPDKERWSSWGAELK